MSGLLGKLNVALTAETAQFNMAMDKASSKAQVSMQNIAYQARRAAPIIGAALAAGATAFAVKMKQTIDDADELSKLSRKVGLSVQSLSVFRHAAVLAGTDFGVMTRGIQRFTRAVSDASIGSITIKRAFDDLGIEIRDTSGSLKDTENLLLDVADKFSKMEDGIIKSARAQEIFGRSGAELIPFLNEGRIGIEKIKKEAEELGLIFNVKTAQAAEKFNDNLTRLKGVADGLFISYSNDLIPILVDFSEELLKSKSKVNELANSGSTLSGVLLSIYGSISLTNLSLKNMSTVLGDTAASFYLLSEKITSGDLFKNPKKSMEEYFDQVKAISDKSLNDMLENTNSTLDSMGNIIGGYIDRLNGISNQSNINKIVEKSIENNSKLEEEAEKLIDSLKTPYEILYEKQQRYQELLDKGLITNEQFILASEKAADQIKIQNDVIENSVIKTNSTMQDLNFTFTSAFEDAIVNGEKFSDVLKGLEKDIIRILVRRKLLEPLFNGIFGGDGQPGIFGGGSEGGIANVFGKSIGSIFGSGAAIPSAHGNAFYGGRMARFAKGGLISSPVTFPLAGGQRGLAGENGPEAILPLMRTSTGDLGVKAGGGSQTIVNVYAPAGSNVKEERQNDGGIERINIYIDEATASNIRPGTKTFRALKENFGLGQSLINR